MEYSHDFSALVTFIGSECAGKTTMCNLLAERQGGMALKVPTWPSLEHFIRFPDQYAYVNQFEAMNYTLAAYADVAEKGVRPIFADICPDRIHLVHSWQLFKSGKISSDDWRRLERQYSNCNSYWGVNYVYLRAEIDLITKRLALRNLPEDHERNLKIAPTILGRWEELVADPNWRRNKNILELNSQDTLTQLCEQVEKWLAI